MAGRHCRWPLARGTAAARLISPIWALPGTCRAARPCEPTADSLRPHGRRACRLRVRLHSKPEWPASSPLRLCRLATLALAPAVGCHGTRHAARGRYPPSRVNGGGAENDGKVDTSKTIVQVDAAATVVASLAAVSIFLRNERPGASHAPPCHTHTRRGRAVGFVPGALRAHVGVRCALDAGYLQGPRPFSQFAARRHGGGRPDPIR